MKTITIQVTDQEHKDIKLAATQNGQSIKDYLLKDHIPDEEDLDYHQVKKAIKQSSGISDTTLGQGTPKSGLESLKQGEEQVTPLFRNQKKGKI